MNYDSPETLAYVLHGQMLLHPPLPIPRDLPGHQVAAPAILRLLCHVWRRLRYTQKIISIYRTCSGQSSVMWPGLRSRYALHTQRRCQRACK